MTVESPCVRICMVDNTGLCLGCGRTLKEIAAWGNLDDDQKLAVKAAAAERLEASRHI